MAQPHAAATAPSSAAGMIGRPVDRVDGRLKVTGRAVYAYEQALSDRPAYGFIRGAGIARGRVAMIDASAAMRAPGVLHVMTHRNAPPQAPFGPPVTETVPEVFTRARPFLADDRVRYHDEPVALVVAETFEAARAAAGLIRIRYAEEPGVFDLEAHMALAYRPVRTNAGFATDSAQGDFERAFPAAAVQVEATYTTPFEHHNPMEPHATLAVWSGDALTLFTSAQTLNNFRAGIASTLRIPPEQVRIVSRFVGGGFGSKLIVHADAVLAALAARVLRRPVKIALSRQQMFASAGHRAAMVQEVRLGADGDGRLTAIGHDVWSGTARFEEFTEQTAVFARSLYAAPHRRTRHRLVRLDLARGEWMRSPGEAPGMLAFESAMDELAERVGLDPIELRVRNEPDRDPERGVPFSTRHLVACMREGSRRFGWERRSREPGRRYEGRMLIGHGMAAAIRPNYLGPTSARVAVGVGGRVTVQLDMTDIGTGTYTILAQIAAERLGVPLSAVTVQLGDTRFPRTAGSGGSWGAASSGSAVHAACLALRQKLIDAAGTDGGADGLAALVNRVAPAGIEAEASVTRGEDYQRFSQHAHGAHFVEVAVDADTAEIRVRRMLSVFDAGRILNPKTARSQVIGGMIWGIGAALMEETVLDPAHGRFVNRDLAGYHVPVNADVGEIDAVFLDVRDDRANPLGSKGIGELGVCGAGAAVANAVHNATGVRVRDFPITIDRLLPHMPTIAS